MARRWGKINDGQPFGLIAWDMARAMSRSGLGDVALCLFWRVIEETWGAATLEDGRQSRPKPWSIPLRPLAREMGVAHTSLARAKEALVRRRFLVETDDGVLPNKNVEEWDGITPEAVAYARLAQTPKRPSKRSPERDRSGLPGETTGLPEETGGGLSKETEVVSLKRPERSPERDRASVPPYNPPLEKRGRKKTEEDKEDSLERAAAEDREPLGGIPEDLGNDPNEVERVAIWAGNYQPAFYGWVRAHKDLWPIAWVEAAISKAIARQVSSPEYCRPILQDWQRAGGPPAPARPAAPDPKQAARDKRREDLARIKKRIAEGTLNV